MQTTTPDEAARRAFLKPVEELLATTGIAWTSITYQTIRPFGSVGLRITAPDMPGEALIVAVALYQKSAIDYAHFPGPGAGTLAYQLLLKNAGGQFTEQCISQDPNALVAALKAWAGLNQPLLKHSLPALEASHLEPLRAFATYRKTLVWRTKELLMQGIARCSEEMSTKLGLVRAPDLSQVAAGLTQQAQTILADDLRNLAPDLLLRHFPREDDGRLPLGATVLLASYTSTLPQGQGRQMWLAACAPKRRRDPQVVTLCLSSLIGANHTRRWEQARWFWDVRQEAASQEERWGVSGLDQGLLGLDNREAHLSLPRERCSQLDSSLADRVALCILLQDAGRFEEAFALFDIEMTDDVLKVLYNQPLSLHTYGYTPDWSATLQDALYFAAPWRFSTLQGNTHHRLCILPHQRQQRKLGLMLVTPSPKSKGVKPLLTLEATASNKFLASVAWRRPLELDLWRFQML